MSKLQGAFTYKDWCILKHALINSIESKESTLFIDTCITTNNMTSEQKINMEHEVEEEKRTLERITERIDDFKKYIKS